MFEIDFFVLRKVVFNNPAKSTGAHGLGEEGEEEEVILRLLAPFQAKQLPRE